MEKQSFKEEVAYKNHIRSESSGVETNPGISWHSPQTLFFAWPLFQRLPKRSRWQSKPRSGLSALNGVEVVRQSKRERMAPTVWNPKEEFHQQCQNSEKWQTGALDSAGRAMLHWDVRDGCKQEHPGAGGLLVAVLCLESQWGESSWLRWQGPLYPHSHFMTLGLEEPKGLLGINAGITASQEVFPPEHCSIMP